MVSPIERGGGSLRGMEGRRKEENLMHNQEGGGRKGAGSARSKSHGESVFFQGGGERIWGGVTAPLVARVTVSLFRFWKNMEKSTDKRRPLSPLAVLCTPFLFLIQ